MKSPFRKKPEEPAGRMRRQPDAPREGNANVYSYTSRRPDPGGENVGRQSSRQPVPGRPFAERMRTGLRARRTVVIGAAATLFMFIFVIGLLPSPIVKTLQPQDTVLIRSTGDYAQVARDSMAGSLANRNKITFDSTGVRQQMLSRFPELEDVSVTLPLIGFKPVVYLQPVQPALLLNAPNGTFIVGTSGKVLIMAANAPKTAGLGLPTLSDQSVSRAQLNQQVLAASEVRFVQTVVAQMKVKGQTVASLVVPAGTNELDVYPAGQKYFAKFNMQTGSAGQQAGTLFATQAQLTKQGVTPAKYIDVRLDGRAYYQ